MDLNIRMDMHDIVNGIKENFKELKEPKVKNKVFCQKMFDALDEDPFLQIKLILIYRNVRFSREERQQQIFKFCEKYCDNFARKNYYRISKELLS